MKWAFVLPLCVKLSSGYAGFGICQLDGTEPQPVLDHVTGACRLQETTEEYRHKGERQWSRRVEELLIRLDRMDKLSSLPCIDHGRIMLQLLCFSASWRRRMSMLRISSRYCRSPLGKSMDELTINPQRRTRNDCQPVGSDRQARATARINSLYL